MDSIRPLGYEDLGLAAMMVLLLAGFTFYQRLHLEKQLLIAAGRSVVQLSLIGLVLKALFAHVHLGLVLVVATIMLGLAGREVMVRQHRRFQGWWGFGIGTISMFLSAFALTFFSLTVIISAQPWYTPQYAIPILGMMLGNTMNSIALGLDRLIREAIRGKDVIEARLLLGHTWEEALRPFKREAIRTSLIPITNAMAAAGIISLPGMMTGQILAGNSPMIAVKYQILILFMITAGSGFGALGAVELSARRLFDQRHRLRLDRLTP